MPIANQLKIMIMISELSDRISAIEALVADLKATQGVQQITTDNEPETPTKEQAQFHVAHLELPL